jgi:hypothetical protein
MRIGYNNMGKTPAFYGDLVEAAMHDPDIYCTNELIDRLSSNDRWELIRAFWFLKERQIVQ